MQDLVLMVVDGPLRDYEHELLESLASMEKRILICLNKSDWFTDEERAELCDQIGEQVATLIRRDDIVSVRSQPVERPIVRVLSDGTEQAGTTLEPPDIQPLADRLLRIVSKEGESLLLANLLMQSRGLVDDAKDRVLTALDEEADRIVSRYMWAAAGVTGANPVPLLDIAGGTRGDRENGDGLGRHLQAKNRRGNHHRNPLQAHKKLDCVAGCKCRGACTHRVSRYDAQNYSRRGHLGRRIACRINASSGNTLDWPGVYAILP